ncbi:MAG: Gp37 family protein [Candidatus Riflebacteria bacterium]
MINTIETAIVARLAAEVEELPAYAFPDRPEDFKKLPFNHGMILVSYSGSSFSEPTNMDTLIQERVLEFVVTLQIKDLRTHDGAYTYLDAIRAALSGFSPQSDRRVLYLVEEGFVDKVESVWIWGQTWRLTARQA